MRILAELRERVGALLRRAFAGAAGLLFAVAVAASYLPARRAGRIDPVRALDRS